MPAIRTRLIYQDQGQLRQHISKVLSISPVSSLPEPDRALLKDATDQDQALITDSTIFYVQGGGQPTDTGTITSTSSPVPTTFIVKSVRHATDHSVLHFGHFEPPSTSFSPDQSIRQDIDGAKRDLHSRLHTAGHILGLAINALSREGVLPPLSEGKGSHYPSSAAVEFIGLIDGRHKAAIQARVDEFVATRAKVTIHYWSMRELMERCTGVAEGFALPEGEEKGRVVEMEGLGSYPCGGTHVGDCGGCGRVEVRKIARSKGVSRVSYRCD